MFKIISMMLSLFKSKAKGGADGKTKTLAATALTLVFSLGTNIYQDYVNKKNFDTRVNEKVSSLLTKRESELRAKLIKELKADEDFRSKLISEHMSDVKERGEIEQTVKDNINEVKSDDVKENGTPVGDGITRQWTDSLRQYYEGLRASGKYHSGEPTTPE